MNIIGIDPSLSCTAMTVNDKKFVYASSNIAYTKKMNLVNWFELCETLVQYRFHDIGSNSVFTDSEVQKIVAFDQITDKIISDIKSCLVPGDIHIGIEGYSYSSAAGPLIDLVTFGTLIRHKIITEFPLVKLSVLPPTTLKLKSAQLTYPAVEKGAKVKKYEWRNNEGVSGGSFKKPEMFKCLTENKTLTCEWVEFLREHSDDILGRKNIPKPIEDLNDSKLIYEILLADKY